MSDKQLRLRCRPLRYRAEFKKFNNNEIRLFGKLKHAQKWNYLGDEHVISDDSDCAKEKRYLEHEKCPFARTQYVTCYDCLAMLYCQNENCTNLRSLCLHCSRAPNFCFTCLKSKYYKCCVECTPCSTCIRYHSNYEMPSVNCQYCDQATCNIDLHIALDCKMNVSVTDIRTLILEQRSAMKYLRDEMLQMKLEHTIDFNYCTNR